MRIAKSAGALLSYDPNLRLPLWPSPDAARKEILSIWNEADIIKVSEDELEFLTGEDSDESALKLFHSSLILLIVTEGSRGCRYYTKDCHGKVDAIKVQAVDTTGAGDAFVGGLLSQLVIDMSLYEDEERLRHALHFANACGAITTTERGAIPALPDRDTVLSLIESSKSHMPRRPSWQDISRWRYAKDEDDNEKRTENLELSSKNDEENEVDPKH